MGRYNFAALRVRQSVINQRANGKISKLPEWVDILRDIPPSQVVVRPQAQKHWESYAQRTLKAPKSKKPSRMFQPQEIVFEEDQLRKEFFRDHPWELARPRILVESSGNDSARYDWSRIQQAGKKLDGESVVQRQLWLLHNVPNMTKGNAYDIARREFYHLRQREDIARRVAAEEAEATGASFGPSRLEIGMQLENEEYERWKEWARSQAQGEFKEPGTSGMPEEASEDPYAAEESETAEEAPQQA